MNAELIALAEELTKEVDENYDGYLIQDLAKEAAAMLRKLAEREQAEYNARCALQAQINERDAKIFDLENERRKMAEQKPVGEVYGPHSAPRLNCVLPEGTQLYAAPVAASPEFVAEAMRTKKELENIVNAKRFGRTVFANDTEFADWAQSRARAALQAHLEGKR